MCIWKFLCYKVRIKLPWLMIIETSVLKSSHLVEILCSHTFLETTFRSAETWKWPWDRTGSGAPPAASAAAPSPSAVTAGRLETAAAAFAAPGPAAAAAAAAPSGGLHAAGRSAVPVDAEGVAGRSRGRWESANCLSHHGTMNSRST